MLYSGRVKQFKNKIAQRWTGAQRCHFQFWKKENHRVPTYIVWKSIASIIQVVKVQNNIDSPRAIVFSYSTELIMSDWANELIHSW